MQSVQHHRWRYQSLGTEVKLLAVKTWLEEMDHSLALVGVKIWNASF